MSGADVRMLTWAAAVEALATVIRSFTGPVVKSHIALSVLSFAREQSTFG